MNHITLSGSFSCGKSTVARELQKNIPQAHHTPDMAREWMNDHGKNSNTLTLNERATMQRAVMEAYVYEEEKAVREGKQAIFDSSLVEVYAYSQNVLPKKDLQIMEKLLKLYKTDFTSLVFPPTIPLYDDNLRHTDPEFRIQIHQAIINTLHKFEIPFMYILSQDVRGRVEEVMHYVGKAHLLKV